MYFVFCAGHTQNIDNGRVRHTHLLALHAAGPRQVVDSRRLLASHGTEEADDTRTPRSIVFLFCLHFGLVIVIGNLVRSIAIITPPPTPLPLIFVVCHDAF